MMNHIGISYRRMMNLHYLCLSHHLSCQEDMFMVEKVLAKNYKVGPIHSSSSKFEILGMCCTDIQCSHTRQKCYFIVTYCNKNVCKNRCDFAHASISPVMRNFQVNENYLNQLIFHQQNKIVQMFVFINLLSKGKMKSMFIGYFCNN